MISRSERVATSLTYIVVIDLCVLCVSVVPLPLTCPQNCILEYILPTKSGRATALANILNNRVNLAKPPVKVSFRGAIWSKYRKPL
ncbi:hypothetical protein MICAI_560045 [Microcystis sp. T1-4]|nr:hypothetical protein MICAI_560045 [Microcystis sp. T1-4]